jgi:hypothetical protein
MKRLPLILATACVLALTAAPQSAPQRKMYRISGTVVNNATGQPLSRVRVLMHPADDSSKETEVTTAADGRFAFEVPSTGMWSLYAERKGFPRQAFGQRPGVPDSMTQVITGPNLDTEHLSFPLDPPAILTGKIISETGEPVPAAIEIIIQLETGRRQYQRIRSAPTDEQGEYRIWDMPAVPCYLLAVAPNQEFAATYYSNTTDPHTATLLDLKPGQEYHADFIVRRARGAAIRITGTFDWQIAMLSTEGPQGSEAIVAQSEGRAPLSNIPPGRYTLTLFNPQTAEQTSKRVDMGADDLTVETPFADAALAARVRMADPKAGFPPNLAFLLHADGAYQTQARTVSADGTFTIPGLAPGQYKLLLATPGVYIQRATSQNAHIADCIVDVPETGTVKLEIVLGNDGGHISGSLRSHGKPLAPARVVLAPQPDSLNSAEYRSYQTETDGSFRYDAIPPGDYIIFATADFKLEFGNPTAIAGFLRSGQRIHIEPNARVDVQLELDSMTPPPPPVRRRAPKGR